MVSLWAGWFLGVLLGLRHAFEPDHLTAVSTLVSTRAGSGQGRRRAWLMLGAAWGAGHTLSLLVVGGALAVLERQMPPRLEDAFECCVALMLVLLGVRALVRAARLGGMGPVAAHDHGAHHHAHAGAPSHVHLSGWTFASGPLWVGVVHGLAGSGALTVLVLAKMPTATARLVYIGLFGLGSIVGMALLSGLAGLSLGALLRRQYRLERFTAVAGVLSLALGGFWAWRSASALLQGL